MISERPRNLLVGLTMLVAMAVFMYGIFLLGKLPSFGGRPYEVTLFATNANGVTAGSAVNVNGVYVGSVKSVGLDKDPKGKVTAKVVLSIDAKTDIPTSAVAVLSRPQTVGNPYVAIDYTEMTGPALPKDGSARLDAAAGEAGLIPQRVFTEVYDLKASLSTLTTELTTVARDLHVLLDYAPPEAVAAADPNDPKRLRENASTVVIRLNRTMDSLQKLLTDPELQGNVRQAIQNIADASAQLKTTLQRVNNAAVGAEGTLNAFTAAATQASSTLDTTQVQIARVSQKLVETLNTMQETLQKITEGKGTTGRLVNDPRLYEGLLDLSRSLKDASDNLNVLIDKWKQEGLPLHLK
jgi:phospholipid/cholesterol/gamma-HCH transport system substrate-binding protein